MIAPGHYTRSKLATVSVAGNPRGYWWVVVGSNHWPLPCEGNWRAEAAEFHKGDEADLHSIDAQGRANKCTRLYTREVLCKNTASQRAGGAETIRTSLHSCAFSPARGRCRHTESAAVKAFLRSSVRARGDVANGPAWAAPKKHQLRRPIESRPGLGGGTGTRRARDGVTGSARVEAIRPTVALGLESHRSWHPDGEGDSPYHPAEGFMKGK